VTGPEELVSADEGAALVEPARRGAAAGATPANRAKARRGPRVRDIDFARPKKFSQEQHKRIERAHESFCRAVTARLAAELRVPIEVDLISLDQLTWSSAVAELPSPSVYGVVGTRPLGTKVLLSAELALVMRLIEFLLGSASTSKPVNRDLTEIEVSLSRRAITSFVDQLSLTWDELLGLQLGLEALEVNLGNVQLAPVSEPSLAFTFEAKIDNASATLSLTVPHMAIESVVSRLGGSTFEGGTETAESVAAMTAALEPIDIELRAEVAAVELPIEQVLAIRPGDVVRLDAPASAGVTVYADRRAAYRARPGRNGRRRAVQVLERLEGVVDG
jgi:flagellar motor switch protein FliM